MLIKAGCLSEWISFGLLVLVGFNRFLEFGLPLFPSSVFSIHLEEFY